MSKSIPSLLEIQGSWNIKEIGREEKVIHLHLSQRRKTADCPRCGRRTKSGYDTQPERVVLHTTIGSSLVFLHFFPRRFTCLCCPHKPFREKVPGIAGTRQTTKRFDNDLLSHLSGQAFSTITDKYSLSYPSQRSRLMQAINPLVPRWDLVANLPEIHLGLDGHHVVNSRFAETITEVKQGLPLGILPNIRKTTIKEALRSVPPDILPKIKSATMDMDDGAIAAVHEELPGVPVVIDHFHVIADANRRLDEARRIEQEAVNLQRVRQGKGKIEIPVKLLRKAKEHLNLKKKEDILLETILTRYPRLRVWYAHKERLREIYWAGDRIKAEEKLKALITMMKVTDDVELCLWGKSLSYYKEEILNYFTYRTTNAYTEGLHVRCKLIQRISSGFRNVDVYIRKAMLLLLPLSVALGEGVLVKNYPLSLS